jgi:hypothetical protein
MKTCAQMLIKFPIGELIVAAMKLPIPYNGKLAV